VTEEEWLDATNPTAMFAVMCEQFGASLRKNGRRKLRLFACSCVRDIFELMRQPGSRQALYYVERYADQLSSEAELTTARQAARASMGKDELPNPGAYWQAAEAAYQLTSKKFDAGDHISVRHAIGSAARSWAMGQTRSGATSPHLDLVRARESLYANYLRDVFGNPFRPVNFPAGWRTSSAVGLAEAMYESREFSPMPILADALEEAGCDNPDILTHCRSDGPHVRGCWVVDLVLGKA
jgi:hypothetical protein